jgi:ketosteroid isomerase-like protein
VKTDRELLAELVHRYADAVVHRNEQQWASTWSENATWILGPGREVNGRAAIVELWNSAMGRFHAVVQNVVNGEVTVDGDTASGRWYIMEHFRRSEGGPGILLAFYDDTYVRLPHGWEFSSRQLRVQYQGLPDLSAPFLNTVASTN